MRHVIKQIWRRLFFRPEREALVAYIHKLPNEIEVSWFRDGDFIIGDIVAGQQKFMTQAHSAAEFVTMVNDAILATYEIPEDYSELVLRSKVFAPTEAEFARLNDAAVKKSSFHAQRDSVRTLVAA